MRGYIHQVAFLVALGACALLISKSHNNRALFANVVYSFTLVGLFCTSALYHSPMWSHHAYAFMRRIDHAAIFALIAGTATPICLLALNHQYGGDLLFLIWAVAILGMLITIFWSHSSKWIRAILYLTTGWIAVPYFAEIKIALGAENMSLLLTGGIIYTVGALVYAFKRPNLFPRVFGYHEVFHTLVVIASGFHYFVIYRLVTA